MSRTAIDLGPSERQTVGTLFGALVPKTPSDAVRYIGALLLTGATASFLLNGLEQAGSMTRYVALLGLTFTLTIGGLVSGLSLQATRTARVMLGIALGSLPVHFGALGGMIVSLVPPEHAVASTPLWDVESVGQLVVAVGLAGVTLPFVVGLSLRTLTPGVVGRLLPALLAVHATLLLPMREDAAVGHLLSLGLLVTVALNIFVGRAGEISRTVEALAARTLLFVPLAILAGRQIVFYGGLGEGWLPVLLTCGALICWTRRSRASNPTSGRRWVDITTAIVTALCGTAWTMWFGFQWVSDDAAICIAVAAFGIISLGLAEWMGRSRTALRYVGSSVWAGLLALISLHDFSALVPHLLAGGSAMFVWGVTRKARAPFVVGAITIVSTLVRLLDPNITWSQVGGTLPLAGLGLASLLVAAFLERHGARVRQAGLGASRRFLAWEH